MITINKRHINLTVIIVSLTLILTWFFYVHETLPKPLRAITALLETRVAIGSGISHYLNLGIPVYDLPWAVVLINFIFSAIVVLLIAKFLNKKNCWLSKTKIMLSM